MDHDDALSNGGQSGDGDRDDRGRFRPGHSLPGPGNPRISAMNRHRGAMLAAVQDADIIRAVAVMVEIMNDTKAKTGDRLAAAVALLNRVLGPAVASDILERIELLEQSTGKVVDDGTR
jgi:hypothetical protein